MIAYFGTGLLGAGFIRKLLDRGVTVHAWNRTVERARPLEKDGAVVFDDPARAVAGAAELHLTLKDDDSVDAVLEPLAGRIDETTVIVDHTTTAPTPTAERARRWKERGIAFIHAPVFMGPAAARNAQGLMLLSGDPALRARIRPSLEPMTGKVVELGDDPGRAAAFKLFGNMLLVFVVSGLADGYRFMSSMGITPPEAHALFSNFTLQNAVDVRGKAMANGDFTAQWELAMAHKDVRLMLEEGARHGVDYAVLPAIEGFFDRYERAGHASEDVGVVAAATP